MIGRQIARGWPPPAASAPLATRCGSWMTSASSSGVWASEIAGHVHPGRTIASSVTGSCEAGPMVATIFVRRVTATVIRRDAAGPRTSRVTVVSKSAVRAAPLTIVRTCVRIQRRRTGAAVDGAIRVLGIDPGLTRCGYAVLEGRGGGAAVRCRWVSFARPPPTSSRPGLALLRDELVALLTEFRPHAVAVERVFFQTNVRTAMSVGQASGLALCEASAAGCEVAQYTPNEVKGAIAGYGAADKAQVPEDGAGPSQARRSRPSRPTPPMRPRSPCATSPWPRCGAVSHLRGAGADDRFAARRGAGTRPRRLRADRGRPASATWCT